MKVIFLAATPDDFIVALHIRTEVSILVASNIGFSLRVPGRLPASSVRVLPASSQYAVPASTTAPAGNESRSPYRSRLQPSARGRRISPRCVRARLLHTTPDLRVPLRHFGPVL